MRAAQAIGFGPGGASDLPSPGRVAGSHPSCARRPGLQPAAPGPDQPKPDPRGAPGMSFARLRLEVDGAMPRDSLGNIGPTARGRELTQDRVCRPNNRNNEPRRQS